MSRKTYHHGDLRNALIETALRIVEEDGPAMLTLRRVANAVGVTPMAPYHHFATRKHLVAAVIAAGFERLQAQKLATAPLDVPVTRAIALGAASYVRFVLDNPNLFRLMHDPGFGDRTAFPEIQQAAAAPAATLIAMVADLVREFDLKQPDVKLGAATLWAQAHGVAILALDRQLPPELAPMIAQSGAEAVVAGWLYSGQAEE